MPIPSTSVPTAVPGRILGHGVVTNGIPWA